MFRSRAAQLEREIRLLQAARDQVVEEAKAHAAEAARLKAERAGEWLRQQRRATLTVHTRDDRTIEGVLERVAEDGIVLVAARLRDSVQGTLDLGGRVFVPRGNVTFVQRHDRRDGD